jgi:thiamine transport system ATP-binding protein
VADRIAVMDHGRLLQVDPPAHLWHHPASRRVAEFLGYEAFVPADAPEAAALLGALPAAVGPHPVLLALGPGSFHRADDVAPRTAVDAPRPGVDAPLAGTVVSSGFRRGVVEAVVQVDGIGTVTVVEPSGPVDEPPRPGSRLALRPDPAAIAVVG